MKVLITGADGFLGRHVALAALAAGHAAIPCGREHMRDIEALRGMLIGSELVIHCAGINRADPADVVSGNVEAARRLSNALPDGPVAIHYANSVASGTDTPYGNGKEAAGKILHEAAMRLGCTFNDIRLPNLFGEGGRPDYNSVTATFVRDVIEGRSPTVLDNRELSLLHVSVAADVLLGTKSFAALEELATATDVRALKELVESQLLEYQAGLIPNLDGRLERHVFNMIRDRLDVAPMFVQPVMHDDGRGWLFEGVRHLGAGQAFFSSSLPSARRGDHYHTRKFERFIILQGEGLLVCKDLLGRRGQYSTPLNSVGDKRVADMHTYETHTLWNTGTVPLVAAFWISEHLRPDDPDTIPDVLDISRATT